MRFRTMIEPAGNATGFEVPGEVVDGFGAGRRPPVVVEINGHSWRTRIAPVNGRYVVGVSAAHRKASGVVQREEVEAEVRLDTEPREIVEPPELTAALDAEPGARAAYDRLAPTHKRRHVRAVEGAKTAATRERRVARVLAELAGEEAPGG
ncbi:hypothetical protein AA958_30395 [Streptomyces sp. CNQ-509]|uniref:YdeI/OmpD-associated family protein n=1 Tax=Streptomyces sp. CNQ-509 TaxID=444103 RepID=UPI00062DDED3|nr:YdeI/OmpD-associated family protein [Streptomyces sp. CNQ-509]AKH85812.1 hypothetical protein AA958_30395 [Streptomyces sp. CNQ-509]